MALIKPQNLRKPHNLNNFIGENYELAMNQSLQSLLDSLQNPNPDLSIFAPTFSELMQAKPDPPLETIWVFCGLTFHSNIPPKDDILDQFSVVKDLFQSITACSASCRSFNSVALIAPVIHSLYRVVVDFKGKDLGLKREKKIRREIKKFLDVILGYISLCCCQGSNGDEDVGFVRSLIDLVSIWVQSDGDGKDRLRMFFPLLTDGNIEWIGEEGAGVKDLAGAVIVEAFLLGLCLKFGEGNSREELRDELRTWSVCSITGFRDFYFFDMLVKMLLETPLPVMSLLSSGDETFLREVLYDAVILVDYSFLHPDRMAHLPGNHTKNNVLARLMVTHEAVEFFRKNGDHTKAISYIDAFSTSHLPALLIKLVTSEIGTEARAAQPNGSSPTSFLKWVLNVEDQGVNLSGNFMSKHRAKLALDCLKPDLELPSWKVDLGKSDDDVLFYIDNEGKLEDEEQKMNESMNAVLMAAARTMQSDTNESGKKRKETRSAWKNEKQIKFQRYNLVDLSGSKSGEKAAFFDKDGPSSGSEVENPNSDEDSE